MHAARTGDQHPAELLTGQASGPHLLAGTAGRRLDPMQPGVGSDGIGQSLRGIPGQAEQHLGLGHHRAPAVLLLRGPVKRLDPAMVAGEAQWGQQIGLVADLEPVINRLDQRHQLGLERGGDRYDDTFTWHRPSPFPRSSRPVAAEADRRTFGHLPS